MGDGRSEQAQLVRENEALQRQVAALQAEVARYRTTLYSIGDAVISADADGNLLQMNRAAEALTGWSEAEAQGRPTAEVFRIVHEETRAAVESPVARVLRDGTVVGLANHTLLIARDGSERPIADSGAPIRNQNGEVAGVVLVFRDQTEERAAQRALSAALVRREAILAAVPDIIMEVDARRIYTWANQAGLDFFGSEVLGREAAFYFEGEQDTYNRVQPLFGGDEQTFYVESWQRRRDGERRLLAWWCRVLKDEAGRVTGALSTARDVTEERRAAAEFQQAEERFRSFFDNAPIGKSMTAPDGRLLRVNPAFGAMLGYSVEELQAASFVEITHPDDLPASRECVRSLLAGEHERWAMDKRYFAKDGHLVWTSVATCLERDSQGRPLYLLTHILDITERKRAEDAMRTSEAQLSSALQLARAGHWEYDVARDEFTFNDNFFRIFRTTAAELGGYHMSSADYARRFCHPDDAALVGIENRAALEAADPSYSRQLEHRILYADGEVGHITVRFFIVKDSRGRTVKTVGVNQDITERKRAESALEESRLFNESLLRTIPFPMEVVDEHGRVLFMNEKLRELVDDQTLEGCCWTRFRDDQQQCDDCPLQREIAIGQTRVIETSGVLGGRTVEIFHTGMVFQGKRALLEIFNDVTEKQQLQAQLAQSDRLSTMGTLAAGVAHEINNPLSYVLYNIESLSEDLPGLAEGMRRCHAALCSRVGVEAVNELLGAEGNSFSPAMFDDVVARFRDALSGTIRIKEIVRGLGTFSRVERTEVAPIHLHHAVEQAINMAFNEIKYRARLVKDLGPVPMVLGSDGKLAQVFLNLLINAAHSIGEGHVEQNEIRVRTWAEGDQAFAEVSDTGKGIAPEHQGKVFEPFFTTKGVGMGTGLGLSICREIVKGFGGEIRLTSEVGKGTRFLIQLPRVPSGWETRGKRAQEQPSVRPRFRGRILVVDDEAGIRGAIVRMLGREHEVIAVASGEEAKVLLENDRRFDLIFCDLMMPQMSGMELHAWLAQCEPGLAEQVVFITGGAFTPGASEYLRKVGNLRMEKPFDTVVFKKTAEELVLAARAKRGE